MAKKNRTEVKASVTANITPTVTVAKHTGVLNDDIAESAVFRKDVVFSPPLGSGSITANYQDVDQVTINASGNITVSFSNLEDGDVKKLIVNKISSNTITFSGVTGSVDGQVIGKTSIHYMVWSANSKIYVTQINRQDGGSISISSITDLTNITTTNVALFDYKINDNVCEFVAKLTITTSSTLSEIGFDITGRQFGTFERQTPTAYPANVIVYDNATANYTACNLDVTDNSGTYEFRIDDVVNPGSLWAIGTYVLRLNGRFFIT